MTTRCCTLASEGDELMIAERDGLVVAIHFGCDRERFARVVADDVEWTDGTTSPAKRQLREYFAGHRKVFDLPLAPRGTPFQQEVWRALRKIPFGRTSSYSAIAERIGRPKAVRAVGAANGKNPIVIVVPCHRVIGRDGSLTGYAGGVERKQRLLALEGVLLPGS
jgi:methylated-DNA-[protein]-cysteine S-methyltransferase